MRRVGGERDRWTQKPPEQEAPEPPVRPNPNTGRVYVDREALQRWLAGLDPAELAAIRAGKKR